MIDNGVMLACVITRNCVFRKKKWVDFKRTYIFRAKNCMRKNFGHVSEATKYGDYLKGINFRGKI